MTAINSDIDLESLNYLTRDEVYGLVGEFSLGACHHQPGDVRWGDPTYWHGLCTVCWRVAWPAIQRADDIVGAKLREVLTDTVNQTYNSAIKAAETAATVLDSDGLPKLTMSGDRAVTAIRRLRS